jgi:hypothetical protein
MYMVLLSPRRNVFSGGKNSARKPRGRWEDAIGMDTADWLQIRNWKAAARRREVWRKEIGEAIVRKRQKRHRRSRRRRRR